MIAFVRGEVAALTLSSAVLEVGGVGLELMCTPARSPRCAPGRRPPWPPPWWSARTSMTLFGFVDEDEKQTFELVQTASGVGPKVAQAMVAVLSPDDLRRAIAAEDVKALTRVPGIGQKGAQRIILELKDRIGAPVGSGTPRPVAAEPWREQVQQGLVGLGWSAKDAEKAIEVVAAEAGVSTGRPPRWTSRRCSGPRCAR